MSSKKCEAIHRVHGASKPDFSIHNSRKLFRNIEERVSALRGVQAASFSAFTFNEGSWNTAIMIPGLPFDRNLNVKHNVIGNDYFRVMQIPAGGTRLRSSGHCHIEARGNHQ